MRSKNRLKNRVGQGMAEYTILVTLVAIACITLARSFGTSVRERIEQARDRINTLNRD